MKIVIFIDSIAVPAGIERVVTSLANEWVKYDYNVSFLTKDRNKSFYNLDDKVAHRSLDYNVLKLKNNIILKIFQKAFEIFKIKKKLKLTLKEIKPDYIYCATPDNSLLCFLSVKNDYKIIASEHGAYSSYNPIYKLIKKLIYPHLFAVIALTKFDTAVYKNFNNNSYYIPNPIPFTSNAKSTLTEKVVISVGRLVWDKGYDMLIDIWQLVHKDFPDWELHIFGEGPCRKSLQNQINSLNLEKVVILRGTTNDIQTEYIKSSIYSMTSRHEGFGMVLIEAMECGLPCISFNTPVGPSEILNEGIGIVVDCFDIEDYSDKLKLLIANYTLRNEISKKSRQKIEEYKIQNISSIWNNLIFRRSF